MEVFASVQNLQTGVGYQFLKWGALVVEIFLLCLLLIVTFLVPVPPFPHGKVPQEALLVGLSAVVSLAAGALFLKSKQPTMSLVDLISSPPCVMGATVIAIVVVPIVIGFLRGR
jgi:hypothetical protein